MAVDRDRGEDALWDRVKRVLPDRYELDDEPDDGGFLGEGGFGVVFRVVDHELERLVAVKAVQRRRTRNEPRILASLNHPHVVNIFDVIDGDDLCLLLMEFVAGKPLHKVSPALSTEAACVAGLAAADALHHAHNMNVLHRDIKPQNLLLADDGTLKIVDFGIARLLGNTAVFGITGTPLWMAPEQRNFAGLGPGTDLYSLGLVLYWLLTGRLPARPYAAPPEGVHEALARVIMRTLEDDIDARHPSAHAFAVDLAKAAAEVFEPGWLKRSGLILRVDDAIREAATRLPSSPIQPIQPPRRFEDAVRPVPGDSAGDRATTPSGQPHPAAPAPPAGSPVRTPLLARANPGGSACEEDQSRPVRGDAERVSLVAHRGYRPASSTSPVVRRRRRPLAIGVLLTGLLAAAVITTVALLPRSSSTLIATVAGGEWFTGDGGPATHAQLASPAGVAVDHTGTLYIADYGSHRVRRVATDSQ